MPPVTYNEVRTRREQRHMRLTALGYADYAEYLRSPAWEATKARYRVSAAPQDCICGEVDGLHLHHLTYERVGFEELADLTPLCPNCHAMVHTLERRGEIGLDFRGFADAKRAERYVREQSPLNERRQVDRTGNLALDDAARQTLRSSICRLRQLAIAAYKDDRDPLPVLLAAIKELEN